MLDNLHLNKQKSNQKARQTVVSKSTPNRQRVDSPLPSFRYPKLLRETYLLTNIRKQNICSRVYTKTITLNVDFERTRDTSFSSRTSQALQSRTEECSKETYPLVASDNNNSSRHRLQIAYHLLCTVLREGGTFLLTFHLII